MDDPISKSLSTLKLEMILLFRDSALVYF